MKDPALNLLRLIFLIMAGALGVYGITQQSGTAWKQFLTFGLIVGVPALAIVLDMAIRKKQLDTITAVYFGLLIGLLMTYVFSLALQPFLDMITGPRAEGSRRPLYTTVQLVVGIVLCYTFISLLLQTRNDFRFIIPYVEFAKEVKGLKPFVLDTSVVIDGRIADVVETRIIDSQLVVPRFVITELQAIADSSDRLKRGRGRRGLDILNKLRGNSDVDLQMFDRELPEFAGQPVDMKLVLLAKHLDGKIVTNDYNLNKVARLQGVGVVNLNDVANALKPVFLPGEHLSVSVVKPGEEPGQGVGYLEDGTMVVVEAGKDHVGQAVNITVTSVLQTSAGRMIFGRYENVVTQMP